MRNMSFAITTKQMYNQTKTVTRRLGWWFIKKGDVVMACEKCQGLKKGEKIKRIYPILITDVRPEPLSDITQKDCEKEGFGQHTPGDFIEMFCEKMKCKPDVVVNRIEFTKKEDE